MPKFAVHVHGTGCWFGLEERHGRKVVRTEPRPMGFYTVRFVEAPSQEEAAARVVEMVEAEVQPMYRDDYPRTIEVEEVIEDPRRFDELGPGQGFTWYPEETSETDGPVN